MPSTGEWFLLLGPCHLPEMWVLGGPHLTYHRGHPGAALGAFDVYGGPWVLQDRAASRAPS
jgi:hypothetical protein